MTRHKFSGLLSLILSFCIAGVAGMFSITGLAQMFSASFWPVVAMGTVLELGKLQAAAWLHENWKNPKAGSFLRSYMFLAVGALMLINGIGVYGFLSHAYLGQSTGDGAIQLQIQALEDQQTSDQAIISQAKTDEDQKAALASSLRAENALTRASQQIAGEAEDQRTISAATSDIEAKKAAELPLKISLSRTDERLGPMKYVAALFGWTDPDYAVRIVILLLMSAFDPLAVGLLLTATISFTTSDPPAKRVRGPDKKPRKLRGPKLKVETPKIEPLNPTKTNKILLL